MSQTFFLPAYIYVGTHQARGTNFCLSSRDGRLESLPPVPTLLTHMAFLFLPDGTLSLNTKHIRQC